MKVNISIDFESLFAIVVFITGAVYAFMFQNPAVIMAAMGISGGITGIDTVRTKKGGHHD